MKRPAAAPTKKVVLPPNLPKDPTANNAPKEEKAAADIYSPVMKVGFTIPEQQHQVTQHEEGEVNPTTGKGLKYTLTQERQGWVELPTCKGVNGEIWLLPTLENATIATCKVDPSIEIPPSAAVSPLDPPKPAANATANATATGAAAGAKGAAAAGAAGAAGAKAAGTAAGAAAGAATGAAAGGAKAAAAGGAGAAAGGAAAGAKAGAADGAKAGAAAAAAPKADAKPAAAKALY